MSKLKQRREEVRNLSVEQINEQIMGLLRDQFNLRMQKATGQLGQIHLLKQVKRDIARLKTELTVKQKQAGK